MTRSFRLALVLAIALCRPAAAANDGYAFTILRGDSPIGTQRVSFTRAGDELTVDIRTEVAVKIAFVTVYRYTQAIRQVWKGERLHALDADTDDNGTTRRARARATAAGIEIEGPHGRSVAPADAVPTGYWNRAIVGRRQGIDSQGRLVSLTFKPLGRRAVPLDGRAVEAEFYEVGGDNSGEVGYAPDGSWVSLIQNERGNRITYIRDGGTRAK